MKKNTILKVLSVVILLTFVLSAVLLTGCNGKLKEDVAKAQTDVAAAQTDINNAKSTLATLQNDLDRLKTTVEASASSSALTETATELNGKIAELERTIADLQTRIAAAETALTAQATTNTALQNKDAELETKIRNLTKDEAGGAVFDLKASINDLKERVDKLEGASGIVADDYAAATDVLAKYVKNDRGELVWNEYSYYAFKQKAEALDYSAYFEGDYEEYKFAYESLMIRLIRATSVEQVQAIFAELAECQDRIPTIAERFETELLKLEGRESTGDEINGIISLEKDQLKTLKLLYNMLNAPETEGEVTEEQQIRYDNILAARAALEAAEEAAVATANNAVVAGLFTYDEETDTFAAVEVLYKPEVEQAIETIAQEYAEIEATYFTNVSDGQKALYGVGPEALTGYSLNAGQIERFAYLTKAKTGAADEERFGLDEIELDTLPIVKVITNPLYSDKVGIDTDVAAIDEWAEDWGIAKDSENYKLIVTASFTNRTTEGYARLTYDAIKAAESYATKMDAIYTEHVIGYVPVGDQTGNLAEELGKEIEAGAENVLYRRIKTELTALVTAAGKLHKAVADVNEALEQPVDAANIAAMLGMGEGDGAKFNAIAMRAIALTQTKVYIDDITATLTQKLGQVKFDDGENILGGYEAQIKALFNTDDLTIYQRIFDAAPAGYFDPEGLEGLTIRYWDYNNDQQEVIDEESVNYVNYEDMTKDFKTVLAELLDEYNTLKQRVQDIYDEVKDVIKDDDAIKTLANLQKVLWANKKVNALEGVSTPSFLLDDPDEPGGTIAFETFRNKLTAHVLKLCKLAESADAECVDDVDAGTTGLNTKIAALTQFNMNRTDEYKNVLKAVVEWIEDYLNIDIDQYFGVHAPVVVEMPTMAEPEEEPEVERPEEEPDVARPATMPDPNDFAGGEENDEYQELKEAYDEWVAYDAAVDAWAAYDAWVAYNNYLDARTNYIRNNMAEYILNLFDAVKDHFQITKPNTEGYLDGKDDRILGIGNYYYPDKGNYKFIENFEAVIAAAEDYLEKYAEAYDEWYGYDDETGEHVKGVLEDINALPAVADIRIHNTVIPDAYTRYTQYQETYYAGNIVSPQFDELTAYDAAETEEDLLGKKTKLDEKEGAAINLYNTIMEQAQELLNYGTVPADDKVGEILEKVAALRANIKKYRDNYCDQADTDQCKFINADGTIDAELVGYKAQAKAQIVKIVVDGIYKNPIHYQGKDYNIEDAEDRQGLKTIFCDSIDMKSTVLYVIDDYQLFFGYMVDPNLVANQVPVPEVPGDPGDPPTHPDYTDLEGAEYYAYETEYNETLLPAWQEANTKYNNYQNDPEYKEYVDNQVAAYTEDSRQYALQYAYDYLYPIK